MQNRRRLSAAGWWIGGFLLLVAALGAGALFSQDIWSIRTYLWTDKPARGPFYWPGAQANVAFQNVRTDVLLVAAGAVVAPNVLRTHVDILISRINLITRPSELNETYRQIPGYFLVEPTLLDFATRILPDIEGHLSPDRAKQLLPAFDELNTKLLKLSDDGWIEDGNHLQATMEQIERDKRVLLAITGGLLLALLATLVLFTRYRRASAGQRLALAAERAAIDAKGRFLGMVSHELRSPLQSIVSALDMIESNPTVAGQNELMARIRRSANSLTVQLRDMLTLARAESGRIELRPGVFDVGELVFDVVAPLKRQAELKGLDLEVDAPEDKFVVADGARIEQILQNLAANAVKYTESGRASVRVRIREGSSSVLILSVSDTGPGIPEPIRQAINRDSDATTARSGSYAGIGLSVVQTLARQLDASIEVDDRGGQGTSFRVSIPVVLAGDRPARLSAVEGRVLVVDDRPDLLQALAEVCISLGHACDTASSAAIALNHLAAHVYETVVIDLELPKTSGGELAARIRQLDLNGKARLVALSASSNAAEQDLQPFDIVLEKPIQRDRLREAFMA